MIICTFAVLINAWNFIYVKIIYCLSTNIFKDNLGSLISSKSKKDHFIATAMKIYKDVINLSIP